MIDGIDHDPPGDRPIRGARASYPAPMAEDRRRDHRLTDGDGPRRWDPTADPGADPVLPDSGTRLSGPALGVDVGGTGVKAALVDLGTAELLSQRVRERTPQPSTPEAVAEAIARVVQRALEGQRVPDVLPVGCGLPGIVKAGRLASAANIDPGWVGWPATDNISAAVGRPVLIVNDADAAGVAELAFGAARGRTGTVILLTLGTGIGSALFVDGRLVPNTEFGHLEFHGHDAETLISGAARERRQLGWKAWAKQFNMYLSRLELYFSPDLFIFGGGVSKEYAKWGKLVKTRSEVVTATFLNTSGIIGAAYAAGADVARRGDTSTPARMTEPSSGGGIVVPRDA
jgi:polyphosphate glucokinase